MLRALVRDSAVYAIPTILSRGIGLLLLPLYTHYLRPEEYGLLELLAVTIALVNLVLPLEISQAVTRFLPDAEEKTARSQIASTAFWFVSGMLAIFFCATWVYPDQFGQLFFAGQADPVWVRLAAVSIAGAVIFYALQIQLRASGQASSYAIASLVLVLVTAAGAALALVATNLGITGVVWAQVAGYSIASLLAFGLSRSAPIALVFSKLELRRMLKFSGPLVLSSVAVYACMYVDRWLVQAFLDLGQLGVYGVAVRIASMLSLLIAPFQLALTPLIYRHYKEAQTPGHLRQSFALFWSLSVTLIIVIGTLAPEIIALLVSDAYAPAAAIAGWMCLAVVLHNCYLFFPGLWLKQMTARIAVVNLAAAVINVSLAVLLIPSFGLLGAALSVVISGFAMFIMSAVFSNAHYPVKVDIGRFVLLLLIAISVLVSMSGGQAPQLLARLAILALAVPVIAYLGGWVSQARQFLQLIRKG